MPYWFGELVLMSISKFELSCAHKLAKKYKSWKVTQNDLEIRKIKERFNMVFSMNKAVKMFHKPKPIKKMWLKWCEK